MNISDNLTNILVGLPKNITLIAVSKTQSENDILNVYSAGHKIFGENKIQEMTKKWENLPKDIQWHMIGHVQTNKVKYMAKYVYLIPSTASRPQISQVHVFADGEPYWVLPDDVGDFVPIVCRCGDQ